MDVKKLRDWAEEPETHQKIVGDYEGAYSLGVIDSPPALLLRVEQTDVSTFPTKVILHGVEVLVIIHGRFAPPVPLKEGR